MYKFIIVDDEALIRKGILKKIRATTLKNKLQFIGEADNGQDGLELIRSTDPDIILTDMKMPEMDGNTFLHHIQEKYPRKKVIVISGYSDFKYMKEAISAKAVGYLLKPFNREEIQEIFTKVIRMIEQEQSVQQQIELSEREKEEACYNFDLQTLCNLILGMHHKEKELMLKSKKLQSLRQAHVYILLTLYTANKIEFLPHLEQNYAYIPHLQNDHIGFFIFFFNKEEFDPLNKVRDSAEKLPKQVGTCMMDTFIGISTDKTALIHLHQAYEETIDALNSRYINDWRNVYPYKDDRSPSDIIEWGNMDELLFFIEAGQPQKVKELTSDLIDYLSTIETATLSQVKKTCKLLIKNVQFILHNYFNGMGNKSYSISFEEVLASTFDISKIRDYLLQVLPNVSELLIEKSIYANKNLIDNIKTYIHKHYKTELHLEKISSLFYINPSYCSYLFKEKTGVNFNDYVNQVRIDEAKILLQKTNNKVNQIAKELGYKNSKYFFRVFKKMTGFTPLEFRQKEIKKRGNKPIN